MKTLFTTLSLIFIVSIGWTQSLNLSNPFDKHRNEYNSRDFIAGWNNPGNDFYQRVYGYDWIRGLNPNVGPWTRILPLDGNNGPTKAAKSSDGYITIETGNFNGNAKSDVFYMLKTSTGWKYGVSEQDPGIPVDSLFKDYHLPLPNFVQVTRYVDNKSYPCITVGDFDGDGLDEVAAYWSWGGDMMTEIISFKDSNNIIIPKPHGATALGRTQGTYGKPAVSITSGDLNGDGTDELIISGLEPNTTNSNVLFNPFIKIYDVSEDGEFNFIFKSEGAFGENILNTRQSGVDGNLSYVRTAMETVYPGKNFQDTGRQVVVFAIGFQWSGGSGGQNADWINLLKIDIAPGLDTFTVGPVHAITSPPLDNTHWAFESNKGDLNNDGYDDFVLLVNNRFTVATLAGDDFKIVTQNASGPAPNYLNIEESVDRFDIGDIDRDGVMDIVTFTKDYNGNDEHTFYMEAFIVKPVTDTQWNLVKRGDYNNEKVYSGYQFLQHGFALGNLDGTDLRLGEPYENSCDFFRPSLYLGCIPYHYDILDGKIIDPSNYTAQGSFTEVSFENNQTVGESFYTSVNVSYTESEKIEGGLEFLGNGGTVGIEKTHGKNFSEENESGTNYEFSIQATAKFDDRLFGHKYPFTILEYPVLKANDDTVSWILAFVPHPDESSEERPRSQEILNFINNYELGNILSYPKPTDPDLFYDRKPGSNFLIWDTSAFIQMDQAGFDVIEYKKGVNENLKTGESTTTELTYRQSVNGGIPYVGGGGRSTEQTYHEDRLEVFGQHFSNVDVFQVSGTSLTNQGDYDYKVYPYLYWTDNHFIRLSMAVEIPDQTNKPDLSWKPYTLKPDPALNMPWRLDSSKKESGAYIPANLNRTRSLRFSSVNPNPGDTLTAFVRVFNYSLKKMTDSVEFVLYNGHPDQGGILIADLDNNTLFNSQEALDDQGRNEVAVQFIVTNEMVAGTNNKIYVVLDPDNKVDEIHEDNNMGYANIGYNCNIIPEDTTLGIHEIDISDNQYFMFSVYPNPSDSKINFKGNPSNPSEDVMLRIYDLSGREVFHGEFERYANTFSVDISELQTGIYIYNIVSRSGLVNSGKVVVR